MRTRLLRFAVMLTVLVSAGLAPCLAAAPDGKPCPMAGCEKSSGASMDSSCCCSRSKAPAESGPGVVAPRPDPASVGPAPEPIMVDEAVMMPVVENDALRAPALVPLFLLHASLLN